MEIVTAQWRADRGWSCGLPHWDDANTLLLVFASPSISSTPTPLDDLAQAYPTSVIVGCSTAGEIFGDQLDDDSVSVAIVRFEHSRLSRAVTTITSPKDSREAGELLGHQLRAAGDDLAAVFVLSTNLVNGTALAEGLCRATGPAIPVTGGLAGDGVDFGDTWVLVDGRPAQHQATAIGLYGDHLEIGYGAQGGWSSFGPQRQVTRSQENELYELDGQPALDLYRLYLGDRAAHLPGSALLFPVAVQMPGWTQDEVVRTVLAIDDEGKSMTFAGDMPESSTAQLLRGRADRIVEAAFVAAQQADERGNARLAVAVSCVGRRMTLGEHVEDELEAVGEAMPEAAVVGFYSYGALSPGRAGACLLHNQTMTITTFGESSVPLPRRARTIAQASTWT